MKNFYLVLFVSFSSFFIKAQSTTEYYIETQTNSNGKISSYLYLDFTSSLDTYIVGTIQAVNQVTIKSTNGHTIILGTITGCKGCLGDGNGGGTTVKTGSHNDPTKSNQNQRIVFEKKEIQKYELQISGNPVSENLQFSVGQDIFITEYQIFDAQGRFIFSEKIFPQRNLSKNIANYPQGNYILVVTTNKGNKQSKPFLKK